MKCTVSDLRSKEVINIENGYRMGCITDVEINTDTGCLESVKVFCSHGIWGFFGRGDEITVCWKDVAVIGDDTVLVRHGITAR